MPKVAELRVVAFKLRDEKRYRVVGPKSLGEEGEKEFRGKARRTKKEAEADLVDQRKRLARLENDIPELTPAQSLEARTAFDLLKDTGWTLEHVVRSGLNYLATITTRKSCTFRDAWLARVALLEGEKASLIHKKTYEYYLRFSDRHDLPGIDADLRQLDVEKVRQWFLKLPGAEVAKLNWLRYAKAVINRAKDDGYVELNPLDIITPPRANSSAGITYLTPESALCLLKAVDRRDLPVVALCLFAGLRSGEIKRLTWEDIHWERLEVHVSPEKAKTRSHRIIPMDDALVRWLDHADARNLSGAIEQPGLRKRLDAAKAAAGITWHQNVLRHSFGTYWLAMHHDRAALSLRMGNTPELTATNYARPISKSVAEVFWNLHPIQEVREGRIVTTS